MSDIDGLAQTVRSRGGVMPTTSTSSLPTETPRQKALLVVWFDVPPEVDEEFNDWHNTEHLPERQSVPGFLSARRFSRVGTPGQYVAMYDLEDMTVLESPAYLRISGSRESPWTQRIRRKSTRIVRNVYEQVLPAIGSGQWLLGPSVRETTPQGRAVLLVPENGPEAPPPVETDAELQLRSDLANPGFRAVRRFVAVEGQPRFLAVFELDRSDVLPLGSLGSLAAADAEKAEPFSTELRDRQYWIYTQVYPHPET